MYRWRVPTLGQALLLGLRSSSRSIRPHVESHRTQPVVESRVFATAAKPLQIGKLNQHASTSSSAGARLRMAAREAHKKNAGLSQAQPRVMRFIEFVA